LPFKRLYALLRCASCSYPSNETPALPLDPANLEIFLKQTILLSGFDGLAELYMEPLPQGTPLHFAVRANEPILPDVAYSAASTIKIPIMVSVFNHLAEPTPDLALGWMRGMITQSENPPADALMRTYLDENLGPLIVTEDMRALGYQNTFLAGYFYSGAPCCSAFRRLRTAARMCTSIRISTIRRYHRKLAICLRAFTAVRLRQKHSNMTFSPAQ